MLDATKVTQKEWLKRRRKERELLSPWAIPDATDNKSSSVRGMEWIISTLYYLTSALLYLFCTLVLMALVVTCQPEETSTWSPATIETATD